jgi:hypothetical protein
MSAGHGGHGGHEGGSGSGKWIGLLIALIALSLAFAENFGNDARTRALAANIEASNLWNFFQAKTVRQTVMRAHADEMEVVAGGLPDGAVKDAATKKIGDWRATSQRYETEPETNEGRRELVARAKDSEAKRDAFFAKHEKMELAAGLLQIAIVLASASIITSLMALAWVSGALGILGTFVWFAAMKFPAFDLLGLIGLSH